MRILAISDQHGHLPPNHPCDLLIVAGDNVFDNPYRRSVHKQLGSTMLMDDQERWFHETWLPWRHRQPAALCLLTWGNHDFFGQRLHAKDAIKRFDPTTIALVDAPYEINGVRLWFTPWSRRFREWAFMHSENTLGKQYAAIPPGLDILVSHQPPQGYGDITIYDMGDAAIKPLGSSALLYAIERKTPKVVICGHIHSGTRRSVITHPDTGLLPAATTDVYNVSIVNEAYDRVFAPTVIELPGCP